MKSHFDSEMTSRLLECNEPYPSKDEMIKLNIRRLSGDASARDEMIRRNIPLAIKIAGDVPWRANVFDFADIVQLCCIGLARAADKFDHTRGASFGTYAIHWMRQATNQAFRKTGSLIRIPTHQMEKLTRVDRIVIAFRNEHGNDPTSEELSELTGISVKKLESLFASRSWVQSLDALVTTGSEGDAQNPYECITDESAACPSRHAEVQDLFRTGIEIIERIYDTPLSTHHSRNIAIFARRFGIYDAEQKARTLDDVGTEFGMTRERVRQICREFLITNHMRERNITTEEKFSQLILVLRDTMAMATEHDPELAARALAVLGR